VELQKNIEENKKVKIANKSPKTKNSPINKDKNNEDNHIKNTTNEFFLSQNTSVSSTFNLQEFYLSIYDAQNIFSTKEKNKELLKNYSMIIDNEQRRKRYNIYDDYYEINKNSNNNNYKKINLNTNLTKNINNNILNKKNIINKNIINNNIINNNKKRYKRKFDKNDIDKIKSVIYRLNNFIKECKTKNNFNTYNEKKDKTHLNNDYDIILKNINNFLRQKLSNKNKKKQKSKTRINDLLMIKKQIPSSNTNFKKISMHDIKKIINNSQNNILNKYKLDINDSLRINSSSKDKTFKTLNKNYSALINKLKKYNFTEEQLNKYKEIFNYLFIYLKLFIQKKIFNYIILYTNIKNKYISGFNQFIMFIKRKPFNYLRIIQQREYYQVILRQFYLPYLNRAFTNIKLFVINKQKFTDADNIIKQIYFMNFLKRVLFFIEIKENFINKKYDYDKIIEEEKEDISYESSSKVEIKNNIINNEDDKNSINNKINIINNNNNNENNEINEDNKNEEQNNIDINKDIKENENKLNNNNNISNISGIKDDSYNKENSETYDEIKELTATFNVIINNISISPKIYVFDLFKKYYFDSKNKNNNINKDENNSEYKNEDKYENKDENISEEKNIIINDENKDDNSNSKNEYSNDKKYNSYLYESFSEKSSISAFPNSEGNDRLHRVYNLINQQQLLNNNNDQIKIPNNSSQHEYKFEIEQINHNQNINTVNINNLEINDNDEKKEDKNEEKEIIKNRNNVYNSDKKDNINNIRNLGEIETGNIFNNSYEIDSQNNAVISNKKESGNNGNNSYEIETEKIANNSNEKEINNNINSSFEIENENNVNNSYEIENQNQNNISDVKEIENNVNISEEIENSDVNNLNNSDEKEIIINDEKQNVNNDNNNSYKKQKENNEINDKNNLSDENDKNEEELGLFIPYKGEIKKNLLNNNLNKNINNNNNSKDENGNISEDSNISEKILKNEFKKYEQNKKKKINNNINQNKETSDDCDNEMYGKYKEDECKKNLINEYENMDNKNNGSSSEEINLPFKKPDLIKNKNRINYQKENCSNNSIKDIDIDVNKEKYLYFNLKKNFGLNVNDENNKRYIENNNLMKSENLDENKKIFMNIPSDIEKKITEDLTNEILNDLFKYEIENKDNLLSYKKDIKHQSNSNISGVMSRESLSAISHSPGRKYNKSNFSPKLINKREGFPSLNKNNNQEEDDSNTSIFTKTVYEIKKDIELNYYEKHIFPKLLEVIENNINKNYLNIINNLKKPLKKNEKEIMEDLSALITYDTIYDNNFIKYNSNFNNNNIIKKEYIDKKIINQFNDKLKKKISEYYEKYNYNYLNQCIYDTTNEIIKNKRMYGNIGEPLLWSMRNRKIEYEYKNSKLFNDLFTKRIINEIKKYYYSKIGSILDNNEHLNISEFSKERDLKFNQNIREELNEENEIDKLDEQETIVKITISKIIMNQLLNEVIEILEHIQYSRNEPEKYNYRSIFSCDNIPLLSFQKENKTEEVEEKAEDKINQ